MNSPRRAGEICPLLGTMMTVRAAAPRNSQAKNMRSGSCWSSPPNSGMLPPGVAQVAAAVAASQKRAPTTRDGTRHLLRRTMMSCTSIAITATVSTLSGQKKRSDWRLSMSYCNGNRRFRSEPWMRLRIAEG